MRKMEDMMMSRKRGINVEEYAITWYEGYEEEREKEKKKRERII
jgi:hypothetical protein